jgi:hypothetical protein
LNFNNLLLNQGIQPENVIIFRHRPSEPGLRKVFPWLASESPNIFNAYQQTQGYLPVENAVKKLVGNGYIASFIGHEPKYAVFVGLYSINTSKPLSPKEFAAIPEYQEIEKLGGSIWFTEQMANEGRPTVEFFDFVETSFHPEWKGKLVVKWPGLERSWWRRAQNKNNDLTVHCIHENSLFDSYEPKWLDIDFTWEQLKILPIRMKTRLSEWRGIYYIFDVKKRLGYVGSAYGEENLHGRWQNYAANGHGGNKLLRDCSPENFRFTILQLLPPDMEKEQVTQIESNWKKRLHTFEFGLNEN